MLRPRYRLLLLLFTVLCVSSCVSHKELVSFNEGPNPSSTPEAIINSLELKIQPEDLLRIEVHSADLKAVAPFNKEVMNPQNAQLLNQQGDGGNYSLELFTGYLVDQEGFIDFPTIGRIEVGGMTIEQAKEKLYELIRPYLKDAVINMRFLNFKVTVIGEVNLPGVKRLSNRRITLLEAIGLAGDLTDYANRTNLLVIREENGHRTSARINLQTGDIFNSPYFYLQQNDIVYVEPLQIRVATVADPLQRIISYTSAGLTLITLIITLSR